MPFSGRAKVVTRVRSQQPPERPVPRRLSVFHPAGLQGQFGRGQDVPHILPFQVRGLDADVFPAPARGGTTTVENRDDRTINSPGGFILSALASLTVDVLLKWGVEDLIETIGSNHI